jgi:membrane fusion protein, copper/silver efflux system
MKNRKIVILLFLILVTSFVSFFWLKMRKENSFSTKYQYQNSPAESRADLIEFWTCSMHPQVRNELPGKCPICGMELVPVYKEERDKIIVEESVRKRLGIMSQPVEHRRLIKVIRIPGKVSHDYELYTLEQEYLSILSGFNRLKDSASSVIIERQKALLEAARLRLALLGLNNKEISLLENEGRPDESLIYPSKGKAWIIADIYEQDLDIIRPGLTAKAKIKGYPNEEFRGKLYLVELVLSEQTRSAKTRIEIEDPENKLKHEVYADVTVEIDLGMRLSIPQTSLIDTGTRKVVYLDLGDGRYEIRQVKTGVETKEYVEVLEGLAENSMVVTKGNFLLDSQTVLRGGQSLLYGSGEQKKEEVKELPIHRH